MQKIVLVVEDDVGIRRALGRLLGERGYRTIEAGNGREAIQRLAEVTPAAIVIDLLMPIMSGVELLKALRRNPFYRTIPTVVMTGALEPSSEEIFGVPVVVKPHIERLPQILDELVATAPVTGPVAVTDDLDADDEVEADIAR
jgi:two-component system, response regulator, stage 0 sporulation protein F